MVYKCIKCIKCNKSLKTKKKYLYTFIHLYTYEIAEKFKKSFKKSKKRGEYSII